MAPAIATGGNEVTSLPLSLHCERARSSEHTPARSPADPGNSHIQLRSLAPHRLKTKAKKRKSAARAGGQPAKRAGKQKAAFFAAFLRRPVDRRRMASERPRPPRARGRKATERAWMRATGANPRSERETDGIRRGPGTNRREPLLLCLWVDCVLGLGLCLGLLWCGRDCTCGSWVVCSIATRLTPSGRRADGGRKRYDELCLTTSIVCTCVCR